MSYVPPRTESTNALIRLLACAARQDILSALLASPDPAKALRDDALMPKLVAKGGRKVAYGQCTTADAVVGLFDADFPSLLLAIPDPPLVLFYRGDLSLLSATSASATPTKPGVPIMHAERSPTIAVVGARKCTTQGKRSAQAMGRELACQGVHVVSGLALGIDGAAHRGALEAAGPGKTIAVMGAGLNEIYPSRHQGLAEEIVQSGGLLITEYPPTMGPRPYQFPERNRLISGVSLATVVIEASDRSGSLITARLAAEQGRDVLAMPGPVHNRVSQGCHRLIQQGAGLVTCATDVFDNVGIESQTQSNHTEEDASMSNLSEVNRTVLSHIQGYSIDIDELINLSGLAAGELTCALVELELAGFVQQGPLGYIRTSL